LYGNETCRQQQKADRKTRYHTVTKPAGEKERKFQGQIIRDLTGHNSRLKDAFDEHVLKLGPRFSRRRRLALALRLFEAWSDAVRTQRI
jgi:hypothetical protein